MSTPYSNQSFILRSADRTSGSVDSFSLTNNFYDILSAGRYTLQLVESSFFHDVASGSIQVEIEVNFMGASLSMSSSNSRSSYIHNFVITSQSSHCTTLPGPMIELLTNTSPPQISVNVYRYNSNVKTPFTGISEFSLTFQLKRLNE
jgi:hypothetical protein